MDGVSDGSGAMDGIASRRSPRGNCGFILDRQLEQGLKIRLVAAVYFCRSKIEAFAGRGKNDFPASRDLEDLIAVVDGRGELVGEIEAAANDVRSDLAKEIKKLFSIREFSDALPSVCCSRYRQPGKSRNNHLAA
jgi:hypothetical protein